jgi:signal transduction histidine kinase
MLGFVMVKESLAHRFRRWFGAAEPTAVPLESNRTESNEGRLATWLQSTQENDRAVLARRLHDELGGLLTAARMDLSWLRTRLDQLGDEAMRQKAAAIDSGLSEAMILKRGVVDRLRPALLDHFGLATALQAHCEDVCRRAGVPCDVQVTEEISAMPPDLALALFRASDFALQRMLRSPAPRHVELIAELEAGRLQLTLQASGLESVEAAVEDNVAVANLQHWLRRYAGNLSWDDSGGGSAILRADAPVDGVSADEEPSGSRSTPAAR